MRQLLAHLGVDLPVLAAPMAGGPSTPGLVAAAAPGRGARILAGGYKTPQDLAAQMRELREEGVPFGVNLFAPNPVPVTADAYRRYAAALRPEADRLAVALPDGEPIEDDDHWHDKIDLLAGSPPPVVSFTFGIPDRDVIANLRRSGATVLQTITSTDEALAALDTGVDGLIAQAPTAGGHSAALHPPPPD